MGWKCPICVKDFGNDKKAQQEHIKKEHRGIGYDIEKTILKMTRLESSKPVDITDVDV